jgi:hypothetical protein
VPAMLKTNTHYDATAWFFTMDRIGRELRELYETSEEMPRELRHVVEQIERWRQASADDNSGVPPIGRHN